MEVAQVARRLAERLTRSGLALNPNVAETAGLAHDLGHPPFGHLAEATLAKLVQSKGNEEGFEGNAQTFRILTFLADNSDNYEGLNLTRASLQATLKYPWMFEHATAPYYKFGAYREEKEAFQFATSSSATKAVTSLEAEILDYADDVTYALYDLHDFIIAGQIPFGFLMSDEVFFEEYHRRSVETGCLTNLTLDRALEIRDVLTALAPVPRAFDGTPDHTKRLRYYINTMLSRYLSPGLFDLVDAVTIRARQLQRTSGVSEELRLLKSFTRFYVINQHALGMKQAGHRLMIETLFNAIMKDGELLKKGELKGNGCLSPWAYVHIKSCKKDDLPRYTADVIASMTEDQAAQTYRAICGW